MNIMLIEDDYLLNKAIKSFLLSKNFKVNAYADGMEAIDALNSDIDLFIIDIDLPNMNGIEILQHIKSVYKNTPIIMISATIEIDMIEKAYSLGCTDYMKKPFDIKELLLKIKNYAPNHENQIALAQGITYNPDSHTLLCDGVAIDLTKKEKHLIHLLMQNQGNAVSNDVIESTLWPLSDAHPSKIRQLISRIRKKIPHEVILNKQGEGYIIL